MKVKSTEQLLQSKLANVKTNLITFAIQQGGKKAQQQKSEIKD